MAVFWSTVASPTQASFNSDVFLDTGDTTPITRAEMSKEIMKKVMPEVTFRKYVSKFTDFGQNKSSYFIMVKRNTRGDDTLWTGNLGEFDPLPEQSMSWKQFDVQVDERGMKIPFTQRAKIFSNFDIVAEVREQVSDSIVASIERDLIVNAFGYLDVLGLNTATGLTVQTGKTVLPTKTFSNNTTPITVSNVDTSSTTFAPLTMNTIMNFAKALQDLYTPSYNGNGYGDYLVIVNKQAENELLQDPVFYNAVTRFQDKEKLYTGYIGSFYGQEFVLDKGKWIDRFICSAQPSLQGKAVAIFLSKDAIREAIIMPEQVLPMEKADFGRYMAIAVNTYRGETPTWFSVEGQPAGGILIGA
jgi:N4-gp56 family major capsid protein